jgi:PAS domain S-box-containing protein
MENMSIANDADSALPRVDSASESQTPTFGSQAVADAGFRLIFDASPDPMWVFDPETLRFVTVNRAAQERYGYTYDEFLAIRLTDLRAPEYVPSLLAEVARMAPGIKHSGEWRHLSKDGVQIDVEIRASDIVFEQRRLRFVVARDITERKRTEIALLRSEALFRTAFDDAAAGMAILSMDGRLLKVNAALCGYLQYSAQELQTMRVADLTLPEDMPANNALLKQALHLNEATYRMEKRYRRKDGAIIWGDLNVAIVRADGAAPTQMIAQVYDITHRKLEEEDLRHIMDSVQCLLWSADVHENEVGDLVWDYMHLDEAAGQRFLPLPVPKGRRYSDVMYERRDVADRERADQFGSDRVRRGLSYAQEFRCLGADNKWHWQHEHVQVEAAGPKKWRIVGVATDITELKKATEALHLSEERLRAMTQFSSDIITVLEPDGTVRSETGGIASMLGYTEVEMVGQNALSFIHPDDRTLVQRTINGLASGERVADSVTFRFKHADGSWRYLESVGNSQVDNPAICGIVVNSRDVTERVRLQSQIVQTEKLASLGQLVAGVAHEVNNPLAAISGHAQLLRASSDPAVRDDARSIEEMVQRASRVLRSLRLFAKPSVGDTARQSAKLNDAILSAVDVVRYRLRDADIDLTLALSDSLPDAVVNRGEIEQVIVNLLTNTEGAFRGASREDRRVTVTTRFEPPRNASESGSCLIIVEDNGCGMPDAIRRRIFDPFFTTGDTGEGTGLGLYIAHSIVAAHGGAIAVETREGAGTRFTLSLPAD